MNKGIYEKILPNGKFIVFSEKPSFSFTEVEQVHGNDIVEASLKKLKADGLYSQKESSHIWGIKTADCLPIFLQGKNGNALVHAGWRGLHSKILENPQLKKIAPIYAFIGPHIHVDSYQVGEDFKNYFPQEYFKFLDDALYFDLTKYAQDALVEYYQNISVEDSGICTFSSSLFHSYRRNKTTQRNWNLFIPDTYNFDYNKEKSS